MTIIPLHPDPNDDSPDMEFDKELLPVKIYEDSPGAWHWRLDHPRMAGQPSIGPFASRREAWRSMMQADTWGALTEHPSEVPGMVAMGALDATAEKLVMDMLDSPDPDKRAKARELIEKHSYD